MSDPTPPAVSEAMREAVARCECGTEIDPNAVFEPGVCDPCSARRFNEEAAAHRNPAPPPIPVRGRFYMICCEHCDWVGSSEQCGTDAGQDDSDVYCPVCCQAMLCEEPGEADTAKHGHAVFDRIEAQASEIARLTGEREAEIETKAREVVSVGLPENAKWLLASKDLWHDRARAAEAETARLRAALEDLCPEGADGLWFSGDDDGQQGFAVVSKSAFARARAALTSQEKTDV